MMDNKVVLVTGSSRGIGRATIIEFAKKGYNVVINYKSSDSEANALKNELESKYHIRAIVIKADVSNELDVMATCGVKPIFISCKTCDVKTEALNELAILRDRFGGERARAAIVTAEKGGGNMLHRAMELGIDVIDLNDLQERDTVLKCLKGYAGKN